MTSDTPVTLPEECDCRYNGRSPPLDIDCCKRYGSSVLPPLCRTRAYETHAYRLHIDPSSGPSIMIRVGGAGPKATMEIERGFDQPRDRDLNDIDLIRIQEAVRTSGFWTAPRHVDAGGGLGGTSLTFEAREDDLYHTVTRWPDAGVLAPIEWLLLGFAGLRDDGEGDEF